MSDPPRDAWLGGLTCLVAGLLGALCACHSSPPPPAPPAEPGALRGRFSLTYYWIAVEPQHVRSRDTTLYDLDDSGCVAIVRVSRALFRELESAGTARLADGRIVGIEGPCKCPTSPCVAVAKSDARWGLSAAGRPLAPFRSIAVDPDVIPLGTPLYIEELDGKTLPGLLAFPHDGCVVADDRGQRIEAARIDWFVGGEHAYHELDSMLHLDTVSIHDGGARCAGR